MSAPAILIIAEKNDPHALAVAKALREDSAFDPVILAMSAFPLAQTATFGCGDDLDGPTLRFVNLDLQTVRAVWWRRPVPCTTPQDYFLFDKNFVQTECDHFLEGLLWSTDCAWVNDPLAERRASRKMYQLAHAARLGLTIPRTIVTNDLKDAREFIDSFGGSLVTKRIGTSRGLATRTALLTQEQLSNIDTIQSCPTTFQQYIEPGGDIRVIMFGSHVHAFWIDTAAGDEPVDSRLDLTVEHRPHELPASLKRQLRILLDRLGLVSGVIDLRVAKTGETYFLEVNPSGQFLYLELMTGFPLAKSMAGVLADAASGRVVLPDRVDEPAHA